MNKVVWMAIAVGLMACGGNEEWECACETDAAAFDVEVCGTDDNAVSVDESRAVATAEEECAAQDNAGCDCTCTLVEAPDEGNDCAGAAIEA